MTTVLGLVGSARAWGNSELLTRHCLRGAAAEGARTALVRLTDLRIEPCNGCMRCVIGGQTCPIPDDMAWLLEQARAADALVLSAPVYWLGPVATVKLVLDRLLMLTGRVDEPLPAPRPAVTLATAGLEGWKGIALPFLNALVAGLGFRPIRSLLAVGPGPGEVLLDEALLEEIQTAGQRLARGELDPAPAPLGTCPVCGCDAFVLEGSRARCPICGREAHVTCEAGRVCLQFGPVMDRLPRWTPEGLRHHMIDWVQATGPRFLALRAEIKARRAAYRQEPVEWLRPAPPEQAEGGP